MITLIHGSAELLRDETLAQIRSSISDDDALLDLNLTRMEARQATLADLMNACDTLPFLAEKRLVVAEGMLRQLASPGRGRGKPSDGDESDDGSAETTQSAPSKSQADALLKYLDDVPAFTELVFVEEELLRAGSALRRLTQLQGDGKAHIIVCQNPRRNDLPGWIRGRAAKRGVRLDRLALEDLTDCVGDDLRQLDQELIKLADFTRGARPVTREDVRRLVPSTHAASVFELVDALGLKDGARSAKLMQHALDVDGEQPLRLLAMIGRQYRLLIQTKALQARGTRQNELAKAIGVPDWTVSRLLAQANRHTMHALQRDLEHVLETDEAIKTGKMTDREAMDMLLAELLVT